MIKMSVGQQDVVDTGGIEAERFLVLLLQLATALIQAAIDQNTFPRAFNHVTRAGDAAVSAVK